jgi:hypothetical protein
MKRITHLPSPAHYTIYAKILNRYQAFGNFIDEGGPISWLPNPSPAYANNVTKSPLEWLLDLILAILSQDMCYLSKVSRD